MVLISQGIVSNQSWQEKRDDAKKFDENVVSEYYDIIVFFFSIHGSFGTTWNLDSERVVYDFNFFIKKDLLS